MQLIKSGIYYDNAYLGVTLGALVYSHGTILIDAPLRPEDGRAWRAALINQRSGSIRLLISLDAHLDRTLGARVMDCTIISHQKSAQVFRNRPTIFKGQSPDSGSEWETYIDAIGTRWASPDITFTNSMSLHWGGPEIILEHHPGPAPGAIWVVIPDEEVVFVGDAVTPNQPPFLANADLVAWMETLNLLLKQYRDYVIISGRGGPVGSEAVQAQIRYLKSIAKAMERIAKRNPPPESTEKLIPGLLSDLDFPPEQYEQYAQRLRAGLYQYYTRLYRPDNPPDQITDEEEEN
jgi:glyoxylase-like metal-dependent hydrolase (beta-lactamase superfamily II)